VRTHFPDEVLGTVIPRSVRVSEAPSFGQTVIAYDGQSAGAIAYREAAVEIIRRDGPPKEATKTQHPADAAAQQHGNASAPADEGGS